MVLPNAKIENRKNKIKLSLVKMDYKMIVITSSKLEAMTIVCRQGEDKSLQIQNIQIADFEDLL
jgi:hypothetical protein